MKRLFLLFAAAGCTFAATTYTYTGNPLTLSTGSPGLPAGAEIQATLTFAAPLGLDLNFVTVTPISYSITDGTNTITSGSIGFSQFTTDGSGNITQWALQIFNTTEILNTLNPANFLTDPPFGDVNVNDASTVLATGAEAYNLNPGTWSIEGASTPEPSTFALLGLALAGLATRIRRQINR